jgi:hypothetical protein
MSDMLEAICCGLHEELFKRNHEVQTSTTTTSCRINLLVSPRTNYMVLEAWYIREHGTSQHGTDRNIRERDNEVGEILVKI